MGFRSQINGSTGIMPGSISGDRLAGGAVGGPQLAAQAVGPAALVHSTWQTPASLGTGWAAGPASGPVQAVQYRVADLDRLEIVGAVHTTTATPTATVFTLPTGFTPRASQRVPTVINSSGTAAAAYVEVQAGGAVVVTPIPTGSGQDVYLALQVPLGNIA
jgi:hypothetical protein